MSFSLWTIFRLFKCYAYTTILLYLIIFAKKVLFCIIMNLCNTCFRFLVSQLVDSLGISKNSIILVFALHWNIVHSVILESDHAYLHYNVFWFVICFSYYSITTGNNKSNSNLAIIFLLFACLFLFRSFIVPDLTSPWIRNRGRLFRSWCCEIKWRLIVTLINHISLKC